MDEKREECCADWQPNVDKINAYIMNAFARNPQYGSYTGKQFVFCPWCGKKRDA